MPDSTESSVSVSIRERLAEDAKTALRNRETQRLAAIRLIIAEQKRIEIDTRKQLNDSQMIQLLDTMRKQRLDAIEQFIKASRTDLIEVEQGELSIIESYLPEPLSEAEIDSLLEQALTETGASSKGDMGKVMSWLKPKLTGRADMAQVSRKAGTALS